MPDQARRRRSRRLWLWAITVLAILASLFTTSRSLRWTSPTMAGGVQWGIDAGQGGVTLSRTTPLPLGTRLTAVQMSRVLTSRARWIPSFWTAAGGDFALTLPFWLVPALLWAPVVARRVFSVRFLVGPPRPAGHCIFCNYDLRPLPPVRRVKCPECGRNNFRKLKRAPQRRESASPSLERPANTGR